MRGYERSMQRVLAQTNQAAGRIENRFDRANRNVERGFAMMQRGVIRSLGTIGVALSGVAFANFTRQAFQATEAIADTADRVGFATDRLQELRYAADQNGSSVTTLDMALQRFSRRLGEAANGSGELLGSLRETGIQIRDSEGRMRSSYDILLDYADAIRAAESDQRALGLAFKAFDSEGASLVTLLRQGREGVEQWGAAARDAGLVLEDGLVRQGAEANRVLRSMQQQVGTEATRAVLEHAQELERLGEALAEITRWGIQAAAAMGELFTNSMDANALRGLSDELRAAGLNGDRVAINRGSDVWQQLRDIIGREQADMLFSGYSQDTDLFGRLAGEDLIAFSEALRETAAYLDSLSNSAGAADSRSGTGGIDGNSGNGNRTPSLPSKPAKADQQAVSTGNTEAKPGELKGEALAAEKRAAVELGEEMARAWAEASLEEQAARSDAFSRGFASSMAGAVRAMAEGTAPEYFAKRLQDALYNRLYTVFENLGQVLFKSMSSKSGGGGLGGFVASLFSFGGGKAAGGPVDAGRSYRVGERGPETFVPLQRGMIVPNGEALQASRGVTVVNQFHLHAEGAVMTDELLSEMDQKAMAAAQGAVAISRRDMAGARDRASKRLR